MGALQAFYKTFLNNYCWGFTFQNHDTIMSHAVVGDPGNFHDLGFFNVRLELGTSQHFASIAMRPPRPESNPHLSGSAAAHCNHCPTAVTTRIFADHDVLYPHRVRSFLFVSIVVLPIKGVSCAIMPTTMIRDRIQLLHLLAPCQHWLINVRKI